MGPMRLSMIYEETVTYNIQASRRLSEVRFSYKSNWRPYARFDGISGKVHESRGFQIEQDVQFPDIPYGNRMDASITTISSVKVGVEFFGNNWSPETVMTAVSGMAFEIRTDSKDDFKCLPEDTQLDVFSNAEILLLGKSQFSERKPVGRRCLNVPKNPLLKPWCGEGKETPGYNDVGNYTYFVTCGSFTGGTIMKSIHKNDAPTFADCMNECSKTPTCMAANFDRAWANGDINCGLIKDAESINAREQFNDYTTGTKLLGPDYPPPPPPPPPPKPATSLPPTPLALPTPGPATFVGPKVTTPPIPFPFPPGAPKPPLPDTYPPRNPYGWCDDFEDGLFTFVANPNTYEVPRTIAFDIQCGTAMEWAGLEISVASGINSFDQCMLRCVGFRKCAGVVLLRDQAKCILLGDLTGQRWSVGNAMFAVKGPQDFCLWEVLQG